MAKGSKGRIGEGQVIGTVDSVSWREAVISQLARMRRNEATGWWVTQRLLESRRERFNGS